MERRIYAAGCLGTKTCSLSGRPLRCWLVPREAFGLSRRSSAKAEARAACCRFLAPTASRPRNPCSCDASTAGEPREAYGVRAACCRFRKPRVPESAGQALRTLIPEPSPSPPQEAQEERVGERRPFSRFRDQGPRLCLASACSVKDEQLAAAFLRLPPRAEATPSGHLTPALCGSLEPQKSSSTRTRSILNL